MNKIIKSREKGFSFFEMMMVLVMLAVIVIIALPNLMNISENIQKSSIEGIADIVQASVQLVKAQALAEDKDGKPNNNTITIDQKIIMINTSLYPVTTSHKDVKGIAEIAGISRPKPTCNPQSCTWSLKANCSVIYTAKTGVVHIVDQGCH